MSITPICKHCGRLIRSDSRAYAANEGFYHWECTEPAPALHIARVDMNPGDAVAVMLEKFINVDQRRHLQSYVADALGVARVVVLDGGIGLSVVAQHEQPNV